MSPGVNIKRRVTWLERGFCCGLISALWLLMWLSSVLICFAGELPADQTGNSLFDTQWGGHLRGIGAVAYPDSESIYQWIDLDPYYDGQIEARLKNNTFIGSNWSLETHLEIVGYGGDSLSKTSEFRSRWAGADGARLLGLTQINDDHRLFNLSHQVIDEADRQLYTRLDRLNIGYAPSWGSLRIGRQAMTWGRGLMFNPMDLFNPFSPSTVMRDYKTGDDMANLQSFLGSGELQLVYVPRRQSVDSGVDDAVSTYAAKWHQTLSGVELDFMAARHYEDRMVGLGASGYLGGAAWRTDLVYTRGETDPDPVDYIQWLINLDYAWQWLGHNVYGFVELYYNGLGESESYADAASNAYIRQRLLRGDQFTLGRTYFSGQLQFEHHPLVHSQWTLLVNAIDGSGFLQPQVVFDFADNWQFLAGAVLYWGCDASEFGGFEVSYGDLEFKSVPSDRLYLWLTYYF